MKITLKFKKNVGTSEECFLISTHRHTFQFILYLYSVILLFVVPSVVHTGWQIMFHLFSHRLFCIGLFFLHLGLILNFLPITDFFNFTSRSKFKKKQQAKYNPFSRMFYLVFFLLFVILFILCWHICNRFINSKALAPNSRSHYWNCFSKRAECLIATEI